jgi:nucleotide-binding universal stress UspA family protein
MYKRILLPLDGSERAEQVLPSAIAQARCFEAELVLLRVFEPLPVDCCVPPVVLDQAAEQASALARDYLQRIAADLRERGIPASVMTVEGRPEEEILRFAQEGQMDLIVMSTHGRSEVSRLLMGSVADHVVRTASVPVLLVRSSGAGD